MADNKRISELIEATALTDADYAEVLQGGINKKAKPSLFGGITREFNRVFSADLLFNKNEIDYLPHTLTGDINYTVAGVGNLVNEFSSSIQTLITDGTHALSFAGFNFVYGIQNGATPEAGTYQIFFMYRNGITTAHWAAPSSESGTAAQLLAPPNFTAVANGSTIIDLAWDDVANESNYVIEWSLTGSGGWTALTSPAAGATSYSHTGLSSGDTRHYRIKAVGDGVNFLDSSYSTASATTEDVGDVTAPTFTFAPLNGTSAHRVNEVITITANEAIKNADGTEITDANVAAVITLKETNSGGANLPFTATIDGSKTVISILPNDSLGQTQLVYVAIDNVEDVNGNEVASPISITFTTTDYTLFNGTTNRIVLGDILDNIFAAANGNFWLEITLNNPVLSGSKVLIGKWGGHTTQTEFYLYYSGADVHFVYFTGLDGGPYRNIKWASALTSGVSVVVLKYDGAIDTNNGLDRPTLLVDAVVMGSKTLFQASITDASGDIQNGTSLLSAGTATHPNRNPSSVNFYAGEAKDLIIRSASGATVELNIPDIAAAVDVSGNGHNGTWS